MEYEEYKKILDRAMVDYVNNGGSVFYIATEIKEYIFKYEDDLMADDIKRQLNDKAIKAIVNKQKLPQGITLEKCIWHTQKKG